MPSLSWMECLETKTISINRRLFILFFLRYRISLLDVLVRHVLFLQWCPDLSYCRYCCFYRRIRTSCRLPVDCFLIFTWICTFCVLSFSISSLSCICNFNHEGRHEQARRCPKLKNRNYITIWHEGLMHGPPPLIHRYIVVIRAFGEINC